MGYTKQKRNHDCREVNKIFHSTEKGGADTIPDAKPSLLTHAKLLVEMAPQFVSKYTGHSSKHDKRILNTGICMIAGKTGVEVPLVTLVEV